MTNDPPAPSAETRDHDERAPRDSKATKKRKGKPRTKKLNPALLPKMAVNVEGPAHTARKSHRNVGRPRVDDAPMQSTFLNAMRLGLFETTAQAIAGVSDSVLKRWKAEPAQKEGLDFGARMRKATSGGVALFAGYLHNAAKRGNVEAIKLYLTRRSAEFREKQVPEAGDMQEALRTFVAAAFSSQRGTADPSVLERTEKETPLHGDGDMADEGGDG